jgi:hypothetical protein
MFRPITRRSFVSGSLKVGAVAGLGDFAFLGTLPSLRADEAKVTPKLVQFNPDIEPLVRLIADTDRAKVLEAVAERIRKGTSYQELLAATLLAGVRDIQPRPVGFKFHAVLVINSAHLASLAARDQDRWLPLFWAVDNYKNSQAQNKQQGDWHMQAVEEAKLPPPHAAKDRFVAAMDDWDEEATDRAVAALARTASAGEVIELFWRFCARDFRDIGHKAIYTANAWRTLQTIGWRHSEPVLRSLAYALLERGNQGNPAKNDFDADRPGRENLKRVAGLSSLNRCTKDVPEATTDLLDTLRTASASDASGKVSELLRNEVKPERIWDALFLTAGELLMRQPGIVGLHCVTSVNALHYGFQASGNDDTRKFLTLQTAAFLALFREAMKGRGNLADVTVATLKKSDEKLAGEQTVEEIFDAVSKDRTAAAQKTLAFLGAHPDGATALMDAARRLIFTKGRDSHDYKFSSAALEDYYNISPAWRNQFLATSMFNLKGSGDRDNDLIRRTKAALAQG